LRLQSEGNQGSLNTSISLSNYVSKSLMDIANNSTNSNQEELEHIGAASFQVNFVSFFFFL